MPREYRWIFTVHWTATSPVTGLTGDYADPPVVIDTDEADAIARHRAACDFGWVTDQRMAKVITAAVTDLEAQWRPTDHGPWQPSGRVRAGASWRHPYRDKTTATQQEAPL